MLNGTMNSGTMSVIGGSIVPCGSLPAPIDHAGQWVVSEFHRYGMPAGWLLPNSGCRTAQVCCRVGQIDPLYMSHCKIAKQHRLSGLSELSGDGSSVHQTLRWLVFRPRRGIGNLPQSDSEKRSALEAAKIRGLLLLLLQHLDLLGARDSEPSQQGSCFLEAD